MCCKFMLCQDYKCSVTILMRLHQFLEHFLTTETPDALYEQYFSIFEQLTEEQMCFMSFQDNALENTLKRIRWLHLMNK
jgi:hypothetical protein